MVRFLAGGTTQGGNSMVAEVKDIMVVAELVKIVTVQLLMAWWWRFILLWTFQVTSGSTEEGVEVMEKVVVQHEEGIGTMLQIQVRVQVVMQRW